MIHWWQPQEPAILISISHVQLAQRKLTCKKTDLSISCACDARFCNIHTRLLFYLLVTYLSKSSMKLVQEFLTISIIKIFFGYSSHVVKWEKLELGFNESVFWAFSWHNISKIKALFNSHASIHTSSKEAGKHKQNKDLKGNVKTDRIILWNSVYLQCNLM